MYNILNLQTVGNKFYGLGGMGSAFIYVSDTTGSKWKNIVTDSISNPYALIVTYDSSNNIYVLTTLFGGGSPCIYKSSDQGLSWSHISFNFVLIFR